MRPLGSMKLYLPFSLCLKLFPNNLKADFTHQWCVVQYLVGHFAVKVIDGVLVCLRKRHMLACSGGLCWKLTGCSLPCRFAKRMSGARRSEAPPYCLALPQLFFLWTWSAHETRGKESNLQLFVWL
ncbi:unnamed protein product, partial [Ixodes persulcatus]